MFVLVAANWLPPRSAGELGGFAILCATASASFQGRLGSLTFAEILAPMVIAGLFAVITSRRRLARERDLRRLSVTDPLTRLPNRSVTMEFLRRELHRRDASSPVTVLFVDLDNFKSINDRYGHSVGDLVLREVADRLSATLREEDVVTRYAGDEFVVVCTAVSSRSDAERLCSRVAARVSAPVTVSGGPTAPLLVRPTASIGAVVAVDRSWTADELLVLADKAMFSAKAAGGNRFHVLQLLASPRQGATPQDADRRPDDRRHGRGRADLSEGGTGRRAEAAPPESPLLDIGSGAVDVLAAWRRCDR